MKKHLEEYFDCCKYRKELNQKTLKAYRIDLNQFFEFLQEEEAKKHNIEQYITGLHKNFKQKTVKRKIASIKAFFNYLDEEELLSDGNPFHKIKVKFRESSTLPRIIPRDSIEKLLNYMYGLSKLPNENRNILRDLALVELLFATGIRVFELSYLKREDIDLNSGTLRILGKGSKERYVQIGNQDVLQVLKMYDQDDKGQLEVSEYFFTTQQGRRLTEQSVRLLLKKYSLKAGLSEKITPHMFRHSVATYLLEEGVDVSYIQKILGHSSIRTTQIYLYVSSKKQAELLRTYHPRNKMSITMPL